MSTGAEAEGPLKPKDVWTIRVRLQLEGRKRDLAMFNLAIDSKLMGCDLVGLKIDDVSTGRRHDQPYLSTRQYADRDIADALGRYTQLFPTMTFTQGRRPT